MLWKPAFFGVKPEIVIKGGFIAWAQMGDPNARIPTPQPVLMRPMFGAFGRRQRGDVAGVRLAALARQRDGRGATAWASACQLSEDAERSRKRDMKLNDALPRIHVDAETYTVTADGEVLRAKAADVLPLAQRYLSVLAMF